MRDRPDILWIECDQLRADALGCYAHGGPQTSTPRIDELANTGVRFDECYCNSPVCCPSRTSTLTGLPPEATGIYHNEDRGVAVHPSLIPFPERFAAAGYRTANFGRMDVPHALRSRVWQHHDPAGGGAGDIKRAMPGNGLDPQVGAAFPADQDYPSNGLVDNALRWWKKATGPRLMRVSFFEPHPPLCPPPPFDRTEASFDTWDNPPVDGLSVCEQAWIDAWRERGYTSDQFADARRNYAGVVAWIDAQVGRLLDPIDRQRTVVVFSADHGASLGEWGCFGKHMFWRWTLRVPMLIGWSGMLDAGQARGDVCERRDLGATLLDLAGLSDEAEACPGVRWFSDNPREAAFATIGRGESGSFAATNSRLGRRTEQGGWPRRTCVRTPRCRLDRNTRLDGRDARPDEYDTMLVDRHDDPLEIKNRIGDSAMRLVADELMQRLDEHLTKWRTSADESASY